MWQQLRAALAVLAALTALTGFAYPALVTVAAQLAFPHQANGSILRRDGSALGSELIGQPFDKPEYFWGRLSATSPVPYNAANSGGSNFGPLHPGLREAAQARIAALAPDGSSAPPVDLAEVRALVEAAPRPEEVA